jgi:hypothetical protein
VIGNGHAGFGRGALEKDHKEPRQRPTSTVTSRGALRRELTACLRTGRALRKPGPRAAARNRARDMINIAQRPQEADDRAVPGH